MTPAFSPPESSRGPRCEWYEAGNRSHFFEQLGLGCIPFAVGIAAEVALRRYAAKRGRPSVGGTDAVTASEGEGGETQ